MLLAVSVDHGLLDTGWTGSFLRHSLLVDVEAVDLEGVVSLLAALGLHFVDVGERVDGTPEVGLPPLRVRLVLTRYELACTGQRRRYKQLTTKSEV